MLIDQVAVKIYYSENISYTLPVTTLNQPNTIDLTTGTMVPLGGEFRSLTTPGAISGNVFSSTAAGIGNHDVIYGFEDCNGCFFDYAWGCGSNMRKNVVYVFSK